MELGERAGENGLIGILLFLCYDLYLCVRGDCCLLCGYWSDLVLSFVSFVIL